MGALSKVNTVVAGTGASGATGMATAAANYNSAMGTAITTALAVTGINLQSLTVVNNPPTWDSTYYTFTGSIQYTTGG